MFVNRMKYTPTNSYGAVGSAVKKDLRNWGAHDKDSPRGRAVSRRAMDQIH